jgi:hypothetical protein
VSQDALILILKVGGPAASIAVLIYLVYSAALKKKTSKPWTATFLNRFSTKFALLALVAFLLVSLFSWQFREQSPPVQINTSTTTGPGSPAISGVAGDVHMNRPPSAK